MTKQLGPTAIMALVLMFAVVAAAVAVRGRVDFVGPLGSFPMAQARVQLCPVSGGGCMSYVTGGDGMYYFPAAPAGQHALIVNGTERLRVVVPNDGYFDVPPVRGN